MSEELTTEETQNTESTDTTSTDTTATSETTNPACQENNVTGTATEEYQSKINAMTSNLTSMAKVISLFCSSRTEDTTTKSEIETIISTMAD